MKVILSKRLSKAGTKINGDQLPVVLDMSVPNTPVFKGFSHTVEEGLKMSQNGSYSEIPGLELNQK